MEFCQSEKVGTLGILIEIDEISLMSNFVVICFFIVAFRHLQIQGVIPDINLR